MAIRNSMQRQSRLALTTTLVTFGTAGVNVEAEVTETRADGVDPTIFHTVRGTMRFPHRPRVAVEFTIEEFQGDLTTTVNSFGGELDDRSLKLIFETALSIVELRQSLEP